MALNAFSVLGIKGMVITCVSLLFFCYLTAWTALEAMALYNTAPSCNPQDHFFGPHMDKWPKHMAPPMTGDVANEGSCNAQWKAGYDKSTFGLGWVDDLVVPNSTLEFEDCCSENCAGCEDDWASTYNTRAPRLNACLQRSAEHYGSCAPHIDCKGEYTPFHNADRFAYELVEGCVPRSTLHAPAVQRVPIMTPETPLASLAGLGASTSTLTTSSMPARPRRNSWTIARAGAGCSC